MSKKACPPKKSLLERREYQRYTPNISGNIIHVNPKKEACYKLLSPKAEHDGSVLSELFICGETKDDKDYYCCFQHTRHACAMYFVSGRGELAVDDTEYDIVAGDVVLMREGHRWEYKTDPCDPWNIMWINFKALPLFSLLDYYELPPICRFNTPGLSSLIQKMVESIRDSRNTLQTRDSVMEYALHLIQYISQRIMEKKGNRKQVKIAGLIMDYINTHITEAIRVGDIADMMFLSNAAIANAFRSVYGCSIKDYIMRSKLEIAVRLLQDGDHEIADIAEKLSFCDPQHFSKMFKRRYKTSPAKYRTEFLSQIIK